MAFTDSRRGIIGEPKMQQIGRGAEANLYLECGKLVKHRIKKDYRICEIDIRIRKSRTKREAKLLERAGELISVPMVFETDSTEKIVMEFVEGKTVKEFMGSADDKEVKKISEKIGGYIRKLHEGGIVHNDLTTSNMIIRGGKLVFIDFGLGVFSKRLEEQAMDLVVLKKSLRAAHTERFEPIWESILAGYGQDREIECRIKTIEKRVRYA